MSLKDKYFPVLDHGFIALKDFMGSDEDIEQAARVSYGKGTRKRTQTRGLIRYLLSHKHTSPLEMVEFKFHVRVPMDCWRQWIRHRTASVNEYSTRYSQAIDLCQQTSPDKWRLQSSSNKQGSGDYYEDGGWLSASEVKLQRLAQLNYQRRLDCGIAREQARKDLPLSTYTEAYWKIDLHNLLHFMRLRCDSHAQIEIRSYANVIAGIVKQCCPLTFEAWEDYIFGAVTFSYQEMIVLQDLVWDEGPPNTPWIGDRCKDLGLSDREADDFIRKITVAPRKFDASLPEPQSYEYFQEESHEKSDKMAEPTP
jgi:thymidylate synthase (FAD)